MSDSHHTVDPPNRLSIAHLLLWMATTGAVLAFLQAIDAPAKRPFPNASSALREYHSAHQASWVIHRLIAPAYGAALAGAALTLSRVIAGTTSFPNQPGHWLLLALCPWTLGLAMWICLTRRFGGADSLEGTIFAAIMLAVGGITGTAALHAIKRSEGQWSWAFLILTMAAGAIALFGIAIALSDPPGARSAWPFLLLAFVWSVLGLLTMTSAILVELRQRKHRDVLHWTGIVCVFVTVAHAFLHGF